MNDQRHRVALAGLAAGAAVAAVFRRKKGGGEGEFGTPMPAAAPPEPAAPAMPADPGPPAESAVPPAATSSAVAPAEPVSPLASSAAASTEPVPPPSPAAAPTSPADPPTPAPERPAGSISDPTTGELSAEEASILAILAQSGRVDDDRTAIAVATSLERDTADVGSVLEKLGAEGVVSDEKQTSSGDKIWAVTERGVRRLGAQH